MNHANSEFAIHGSTMRQREIEIRDDVAADVTWRAAILVDHQQPLAIFLGPARHCCRASDLKLATSPCPDESASIAQSQSYFVESKSNASGRVIFVT